MKKMPDHCNGHSIGFFQTITAAVGRLVKFPVDDCFEFHRARLASPLHQVTIVQVIKYSSFSLLKINFPLLFIGIRLDLWPNVRNTTWCNRRRCFEIFQRTSTACTCLSLASDCFDHRSNDNCSHSGLQWL